MCWTPKSGGTTQALRIAQHYKLPIFNFFFDDHIARFQEFLSYAYDIKWRGKLEIRND